MQNLNLNSESDLLNKQFGAIYNGENPQPCVVGGHQWNPSFNLMTLASLSNFL